MQQQQNQHKEDVSHVIAFLVDYKPDEDEWKATESDIIVQQCFSEAIDQVVNKSRYFEPPTDNQIIPHA